LQRNSLRNRTGNYFGGTGNSGSGTGNFSRSNPKSSPDEVFGMHQPNLKSLYEFAALQQSIALQQNSCFI
jgi:hypothetical protein